MMCRDTSSMVTKRPQNYDTGSYDALYLGQQWQVQCHVVVVLGYYRHNIHTPATPITSYPDYEELTRPSAGGIFSRKLK